MKLKHNRPAFWLTPGSLATLLVLTGCASTGAFSRTGPALFAFATESGTAFPETAAKRGEACSHNLLGLIAFGDSSIAAAKKSASITRVSTVDTSYTNILFLFGGVCTKVTGQ